MSLRAATWKSSLEPTSLDSLAEALGYSKRFEGTENPHLDYIVAQAPDHGKLQDYIDLFTVVVRHFRDVGHNIAKPAAPAPDSIRNFVEDLIEENAISYIIRIPSGPERAAKVLDLILYIIGVWVFMKGYFISPLNDYRRVILAYSQLKGEEYSQSTALDQPLHQLIGSCGLLPNASEPFVGDISQISTPSNGVLSETSLPGFHLHAPTDSTEALMIVAESLNAIKLSNLSAVHIHWTENISRHLLLSKRGRITVYLELFAIPSALQTGPRLGLEQAGIPSDIMTEIEWSYANLFNPIEPRHGFLARLMNWWCPCLACTSTRFRNRELKQLKAHPRLPYDQKLEALMHRPPQQWDQTLFRQSWPRIKALEHHLLSARPWKFSAIFRDRRDTLQYWTFLFGTIILILTVIQVILGAAQVAGSFI